ncbi:sterol desaturase family protein [Nocardioides sp. SOB77]|uniref:Sterol desaturase family protein n=1 Tax=Nocardioides oceani TaxID=3058369 RepID=A0ABT8FIG4_9ACTN|nr:sterol desaturase family protein [Nocardioides oceani]MDN4174389.1 sterol desaturase family protein [Nocardioides oceani]
MTDALQSTWHAIPEALREPVVLAMPFFLLFVVVEALAAYFLEDERPDGSARYDGRDAWTSVSLGSVSVVTMALWKLLGLAVYTVLFVHVAPWQLPADAWWTVALAVLGVDFFFYWAHRVAHRVRLVWATHQAHHSSEHFNFSTALRQKWNNSHELVIWAPLPLLGVPPALVFLGFSISLVYQFFVHTERIRTLPRPIELVFNTPSHHRVHHGSDPEYLDRNYGGILIVWDRLFGTFQPELHRPTYGLTKPVGTYNLLTLQTHEYAAIARDVRGAPTLRDKLGYVFGPPGWRPATARATAGVLPAEVTAPVPAPVPAEG